LRITATIKSELIRGFCFAYTDDNEKFYIHVSNVEMPEDLLQIGLKVSFDPREPEPGKVFKRAMRVRLAE
jgi:cold shock CspA family protein